MARAYLFDLDGTLLDSEPIHKKSEVEIFSRFGVTIVPEDLAPYMGLTLREMLRRMNERFGSQITEDAFREHSYEVLGGLVRTEMQVFGDALAVVPRLQAPCAIVTSSNRWYVDAVAAKFPDFFAHFAAVVTANDVSQGKPHPEPFLLGAERLGVSASDCVAVEDSPNGVLSAKAAGCETWHVCRSVEPHPDADRSGLSLARLFENSVGRELR